jgi:hypothetical protein
MGPPAADAVRPEVDARRRHGHYLAVSIDGVAELQRAVWWSRYDRIDGALAFDQVEAFFHVGLLSEL